MSIIGILTSEYYRGYEAGRNAEKITKHSDYKKALERMLNLGYQLGRISVNCEIEEINVDDLKDLCEEKKEGGANHEP